MTFPPLSARKNAPTAMPLHPEVKNPVSTGGGGIPASLKIKNAGSKNAPGVEKNVNES